MKSELFGTRQSDDSPIKAGVDIVRKYCNQKPLVSARIWSMIVSMSLSVGSEPNRSHVNV